MKYTCSNTCTQHDFIINCYFHSKKFWYLTLQKINFIFYSMNKLLYFTVILYIVYYVAYIHVINCNKASIFKSLSLVKKTTILSSVIIFLLSKSSMHETYSSCIMYYIYKVIFYVRFSWHSAFLSRSVSCSEISAVPMVLKTPDFESYTSDQLASCDEYYCLKCRHCCTASSRFVCDGIKESTH